MASLSRRDFMKGMAAGALALACPRVSRSAASAGRKPNIIFIIADDMGYADLGCFGSKTILTPNIDRMASEGIKFTDCYSGDTVCAPARSTLMTGLHKGHTPVRGNSGGIPLFPEDVTVAEVLKKAGYATGGFGKWGLGNQGKDGAAERQGFDLFYGYYNQWHAHSYYTNLFRNSEIVNEDRGYTHYAIFAETIKFIKANADKPFFCYCPWTPPHATYQMPEDDPAVALYKDKPWPQDAKTVAAMDSMMDRQVGEILSLLKTLGIEEDTIVFFTSDNGAAERFDGVHDSSGKFKGFKRSMNEGGIRVPMVVRWPGRINAGQVSALPWYFPDVMPTLAELAGAAGDVPKNIDGISIVPTLLATGQQMAHEYLYWAIGDKQPGTQAVRMGKFKGIGGADGVKLYDLSVDVGEEHDLAAEHPDVAKKICDIMAKAWLEPRSRQDDGKHTGEKPAKKQ